VLLGILRMDQHAWWYLARASGIVSWILISSSVIWGLAVAGRLTKKRPPAAWNLDLHRFLGGTAVVFTGLHLTGLAMDRYVNFGPTDLLVPYVTTWRPGSVAWGIVGLYVLLAIEITSLLMKHLPRKLWRYVHLTSFALWAMATIHGLWSGTDARNPVLRLTGIGLLSFGLWLGVMRLAVPAWRRRHRPPRVPVAARAAAARSAPADVEAVGHV